MKSITVYLLSIILCSHIMADVYQGSFEWRRTGTDDYKIALFKFDTITGVGAVAELKPDQGAYANPGFWRFRLGIKDRNIHSDKIIVSSLEDLVNFATKQIIVMPVIGSFGPPEPYAVNGNLVWNIYSGGAYGTISDEYWLTDANFTNAYYEMGSVLNFTHITSPSISIGRDDSSSYLKIKYTGIIQESPDLIKWTTVKPQPEFLIHYVLPSAGAKFWRSVSQ